MPDIIIQNTIQHTRRDENTNPILFHKNIISISMFMVFVKILLGT